MFEPQKLIQGTVCSNFAGLFKIINRRLPTYYVCVCPLKRRYTNIRNMSHLLPSALSALEFKDKPLNKNCQSARLIRFY